jgi:hypothetical protein
MKGAFVQHSTAIALSCLFTCLSAAAQAGQPDAPGAAPVVTEARKVVRVSVDFEGGTFADFVTQVRRAGEVNIIANPGLERVQVPALKLRDVGVEAALEAVARMVSTDRVNVSIADFRQGGGQPVYTVYVNFREKGHDVVANVARTSTQVAVLTLERLTAAQPDGAPPMRAETILTAIDAAFELGKDEQAPPTLKFHRESGLLFVRGTHDQVALVQQVLATLRNDVEARIAWQRRDRAQKANPDPAPEKPQGEVKTDKREAVR